MILHLNLSLFFKVMGYLVHVRCLRLLCDIYRQTCLFSKVIIVWYTSFAHREKTIWQITFSRDVHKLCLRYWHGSCLSLCLTSHWSVACLQYFEACFYSQKRIVQSFSGFLYSSMCWVMVRTPILMMMKMTMLATKWAMRQIFPACCRILQGLTVLRQVDVDLRKQHRLYFSIVGFDSLEIQTNAPKYIL